MGQSASSAGSAASATLGLFTKEKTLDLFQTLCYLKLQTVEIKSICTKLNITNITENPSLSYSDLAYVLGLSESKDQDNDAVNPKFGYVIKLLYESLKVMGRFPFLQDYTTKSPTDALTLNDLIISAFFHTGRYKKSLSADYDYLKLVFITLGFASQRSIGEEPEEKQEEKTADKPQVTEKFAEGDLETFLIEVKKNPLPDMEDTKEFLARRVLWDTFSYVQSFDEIDIDALHINAYDLVQVFTLFLILTSVPRKKHNLMQSHTIKNISSRWDEFEAEAIHLVRYIDINITASNYKTVQVNYQDFKAGVNNSVKDLFKNNFMRLFKDGLLSAVHSSQIEEESKLPVEPVQPDPKIPPPKITRKKISFPKFEESNLVNDPTLAIISSCMQSIGSEIEVSRENLVKLYDGSQSGFSIRSLELKVFKWQAPTLLLVSGKRLKTKTAKSNKRYQQFITEYPRFFRSQDESRKEWQDDHDTVTYAILIKQPWRASNKKNFGDENTVMMCISPRVDYFKSMKNPIHHGELIYFNNLGLGLGFGNDQPISKNNFKKYLPGDVSLTIEANLEFGVFRHIASLGTNSTAYFETSQQSQTKFSDYEDRFVITDLEVWGIGSTDELEEQKRQWEWEEKQAEARQSVNLKSIGEERAFLEMVGLVGNNNASGGSI